MDRYQYQYIADEFPNDMEFSKELNFQIRIFQIKIINTQPLQGLGFYMNTGARCAAHPGVALLGQTLLGQTLLGQTLPGQDIKAQGESSGVSTAVFMGANRTKKTQQTPFAQPAWFACCDRPCLGSLCSVECSAGRCAMLGLYNAAHCVTLSALRSTPACRCAHTL